MSSIFKSNFVKLLISILVVVTTGTLIFISVNNKDKKKDGGSYITINGNVKRIDTDNNLIILTNKTKIPISEIINVKLCNIEGN